ncbi:unnamed protein product [Candidula unifasciata]|uniref:Glycosylphosphatidylinositol anchor attachment 1 protein n=1 Tax=Candidula unifasciata TaxID=100452 RepID=A0A8S4A370_9EUPU|nr:unnamed protein product [Candidula unifasciata]
MGLLTNEQSRNRVVSLLVQHNQKLSVLVYLAGISWFFALAYQPLNAATYFSENALLPGLVESHLPSVFLSVLQYKEQVEQEAKRDPKVTLQDWVYKKFDSLGIETFQQNFSVVYPFRSLSSKVCWMSAPLRPWHRIQRISVHIAGIKDASKPYWSKDIIFLFSDFDEIGAMAWLDAYHETASQYILTNGLEGRSGAIQAAINLELPLDNINYFNLKLEGLNGQLPNLDLVNLLVRLCQKEGARVAIHHSFDKRLSYGGDSFDNYKSSLKTMLKMMWYQASGAPSGNHGLFQKFHIESVTLQGVAKKKGSHDITTAARIMEGVLRSLNNLLERFHQSFFFYLLPSTNRYVSIGMYMPPFGLMALAGLIKISFVVFTLTCHGLALWKVSQMQTNAEKKEDTKKDGADESPDKDKEKDVEGMKYSLKDEAKTAVDESKDNFEDEMKTAEPLTNKGVLTILPVFLVSMLMGWMAHQGPELLTRIVPRFRIQTEDMIIYSLFAIFTAALAYPKLMTRKSGSPSTFVIDWQLLKSIALIGQTLALTTISLLNISQAFFLTAFMVPVTTLVRPSQQKIFRWIQMLALVFVSPLSLMFLVGLISAWPQPSTFDLLLQGYTNCKELIFLGVMDSYLFNAWTETIITAVIFPIWLLFWAIPWVDAVNSL